METKSFKINIPEGFEIDREKSTFEEIIFKPIKKELPKKWEELGTIKGFYVSPDSSVQSIGYYTNGMVSSIRKVFPTREEAEASVVLAQLCQLRDIYNEVGNLIGEIAQVNIVLFVQKIISEQLPMQLIYTF